MARLILLRHGLEEGPENLHGWTDVPLLPKGVEEAKHAADVLSGIRFRMAYTSPLTRAKDTADIVCSRQNGLVANPDPGLRSLGLGLLEDKPYADIKEKLNMLWNEWKRDETVRAPNGESWQDFQGRVYPLFFHLQRLANDSDVVAVTHSHVCDYAAAVAANENKPLYGNAMELMRRFKTHPADAVEFMDGRMTRMNFIRREHEPIKD